MEAETLLANIPENLKEEVSILYSLGVEIEEIKYIISRKLKYFQIKT